MRLPQPGCLSAGAVAIVDVANVTAGAGNAAANEVVVDLIGNARSIHSIWWRNVVAYNRWALYYDADGDLTAGSVAIMDLTTAAGGEITLTADNFSIV